MVSLNGTGLTHCSENWQIRLYDFFHKAGYQAKITRIDLAYDDFEGGQFQLQKSLNMYNAGQFQNGKRSPLIIMVGDWVTKNDKKGRTLYIGSRDNGLFLRIYEKGKQLQSDQHPNWVRVEAEIKSVDRYIPHLTLITPQNYLAGCYPALNHLSENQERIKTLAREVNASIEHSIKWTKRQTGKFLFLLSELGYTKEQVINMLIQDEIPKKFSQKFISSDKPFCIDEVLLETSMKKIKLKAIEKLPKESKKVFRISPQSETHHSIVAN